MSPALGLSLRNLRISTRIAAGFLAVLLLSAIAFINFERLSGQVEHYAVEAEIAGSANEIEMEFLRL